MKNRNIEMLLQFVENPSINLHQLANYLNVSTRSVRNDLIRLNSYLTENNLQNIQLNRDGTFTFDNEDVYSGLNLLQKSNLYEYHLSKEERETFMALRSIDVPAAAWHQHSVPCTWLDRHIKR